MNNEPTTIKTSLTPAERLRLSEPPLILELLSLADGGSGGVQIAQDTGYEPNDEKHCPACKGHRQERKSCNRCFGTGKVKDTVVQKSSRVKKKGFLSSDVAILTAGIEQHKLDAALVFVNDDSAALERLRQHLKSNVVKVQSYKWPTDGSLDKSGQKALRIARIDAVVSIALNDFTLRQGHAPLKPKLDALRISKSQWYDGQNWREECTIVFDRLSQWIQDVGVHMRRQKYDISRGVA